MLDSGCVQNDSMVYNNNNNGGVNLKLPNIVSSDNSSQSPVQYSIPGIICFLQHEWTRLETERQQWHVEKAELEARLSFLQGEQKGQENLKISLIKRIKMLEHALRQERLKYTKLKRETEGLCTDDKPATLPDKIELDMRTNQDDNVSSLFSSDISSSNISSTVKQGRNLLRQYLQEIGYMEKVIDVRTERVRSMLGFKYDETGDASTDENSSPPNYLKTKRSLVQTMPFKSDENEIQGVSCLASNATLANSVEVDSVNENSVFHQFDFLESATDESTESQIEMKGVAEDSKFTKMIDSNFMRESFCKNSENILKCPANFPGVIKLAMKDDIGDGKTVLDDFQNETINLELSGNSEFVESFTEVEDSSTKNTSEVSEAEESKLLGEKYLLRSHYDAIRDVAFHPSSLSLVTASEDHTLKLWHLEKTVRRASCPPSVEPSYTFRGHRGPVLSVCFNESGDGFFSGGIDASIRYWRYPADTVDLYDNYDCTDLIGVFNDHSDAIHSLIFCGSRLVSASADSSIKVWDVNEQKPLLCSIETKSFGMPICVGNVCYDDSKFIACFDNSVVCIWDLEKGVLLHEFKPFEDETPVRSNKVLTTSSQFIVGRDNRTICWCDSKSGKLIHSMIAHMDSVSSLCIDYTRMYMLSGSHDCSVRLWNLEDRSCKQDLNVHRLKYNEAVCAVAAHQSKPYFATAGADGICKILNMKY